MTKPKSKTPAKPLFDISTSTKAPTKVVNTGEYEEPAGMPAPLANAIADHFFPPESDPAVDLDACRHRPSDGTECTAGKPVPELPRIARRDDVESMVRLEGLVSTLRTHKSDLDEWSVLAMHMMWGEHADSISWPCPYLIETAWAFRDAGHQDRIRGMKAELLEYERELAETYKELGRMSSRSQFKTTLSRVVALASLLDGEVVDDIMEQLERGFHMARKAGVSVFEVVLNLKSTIQAPDDEGLSLAMESKCKAGVKLETAPASAKGKAQVGEDGQVLPEVDRFRKTPLGRELTRAEEMERVEQRQREAA